VYKRQAGKEWGSGEGSTVIRWRRKKENVEERRVF